MTMKCPVPTLLVNIPWSFREFQKIDHEFWFFNSDFPQLYFLFSAVICWYISHRVKYVACIAREFVEVLYLHVLKLDIRALKFFSAVVAFLMICWRFQFLFRFFPLPDGVALKASSSWSCTSTVDLQSSCSRQRNALVSHSLFGCWSGAWSDCNHFTPL